ncbi:MAG TPA: SUMF1/EgtB/PvdO family nonheme iron enzyme, partial [Geminicoccaceae bacterium]|nr:SUMF1/EgtB/PvdO family nonheme iron enzyme [Geminicoccaceae bacterium]
MKTLAIMALTTATVAAPAATASEHAPPPGGCAGYSGLPEDRAPAGDARFGMVWIDGGSFTMGSDEHHPEERASHEVTVKGFWIDRHEVTNAQFARFVEATGYRTLAERGLEPEESPGMPPELLKPGSMVFFVPEQLTDMADVRQWWRYVPGAGWRPPTGPGSSIEG